MTEDQELRGPDAAADALAARLERLARLRGPGEPNPTGQIPSSAAPRRARRHPARAARYAAAGVSVLSTLGLTSLFVTQAGGSTAPVGSASVVSGAVGSGGDDSMSVTTSATDGSGTAAGSPTVVDGAVYSNRWGDVQVEATFAADGTLTSVEALLVPESRSKSVEINDYAVPRLEAEAVAVQSAQVHTVSGATYTSDGYRSSLQSAIDAARAAGATTLA